VTLEYCTRLLDVDLYAKTRTGYWFAAELCCYTRLLRKAIRYWVLREAVGLL